MRFMYVCTVIRNIVMLEINRLQKINVKKFCGIHAAPIIYSSRIKGVVFLRT